MRYVDPSELQKLPSDEPEPWEILAAIEPYPDDKTRPPSVLVGIDLQWDEDVVSYDPRNDECPACGRGPLGRGRACVVCSRTRDDPTRWPMQGR